MISTHSYEAGKGAASLFLAQTLGVPPGGIVAAGDSGNDLDLFRIAGSAIAVANARQELLAKMPSQTSYHAMRSHAAGVLEGLVHFRRDRLTGFKRSTPLCQPIELVH